MRVEATTIELSAEGGLMPVVYNKRTYPNAPGVYVGRPSKWGNPFSHLSNTLAEFRVPSRGAAILAYREWILTQPQLLASLHELRGKNLICWCAPLPCHAEILLDLANQEP